MTTKKQKQIIEKYMKLYCRGVFCDGLNDLFYKDTFPNYVNKRHKSDFKYILKISRECADYILKKCKTKENEPLLFSKESILNTPVRLEVCIIDPITGQKLSSYTKASIMYLEGSLVLYMYFHREDFISSWKEYKLKSNILIRNLDTNRIGITFLQKGQIANPPAKILRKVPVKKTVTGKETTSSPKAVTARWKGSKSTASMSYHPQNHDGSRISLDRYFG